MERSGSTGSAGNTGNSGNTGKSGRAAPPGAAGRVLLFLALTLTLLPAPGPALPTHPRLRDHPRDGPRLSLELLEAANASLHRLKDLGTLGFECTLEEVDPEDITENQMNTIKACTSEEAGTANCPALETSTFDKTKCLRGIYEDLRAYRAELKNLNDPKVLVTLEGMMQALDSGAGNVPEAPAGSGSGLRSGLGSFPQRMRLCGVLQAFHIRTVTISRMMNFMSSL